MCHARTVLGFIVFVRIVLCNLCGECLVRVSSFCLYKFCGRFVANFSIQFFDRWWLVLLLHMTFGSSNGLGHLGSSYDIGEFECTFVS